MTTTSINAPVHNVTCSCHLCEDWRNRQQPLGIQMADGIATALIPSDDDSGRTAIGNTPTCESCDQPLDSCSCDESLPPDPEKMNDQRSNAAEATLAFFMVHHGEKEGGFSQNVTDLIADLAHFCDRNDVNLGACITSAQSHYAAETDSYGTQFDS